LKMVGRSRAITVQMSPVVIFDRTTFRTAIMAYPSDGPGCGGLAVGSRKINLKVGDVLIVPPGVIHGWADIPDHVDYLSFRPSHDVMKNGWVNPTIAK